MVCEKKEPTQDQAGKTTKRAPLIRATHRAVPKRVEQVLDTVYHYVQFAKHNGLVRLSVKDVSFGGISFELTPQALAEASRDKYLKSLTPEQKEKMAEDRGTPRRPGGLAYWSSGGPIGENRGQDMVRPGKPKQRPG